MEANYEKNGILDLLIRPGFCVKENKIIQANAAAQGLLLQPGMDVRELLLTGQEEYAAFTGGCLYVTLKLPQNGCGASVTCVDDGDIFVLEQEADATLQALALAARELRDPLTSMILGADRLASAISPEDARMQEQLARMNRSLHQMLRLLGNMSDTGCNSPSRKELVNFGRFFDEILEKAGTLVAQAGIQLTYQGLSQELYGLADPEQLERAVWNLLSNAVKFTPQGGLIQIRLTHQKKLLSLHILDSGSGIAQQILGSAFSRYLRQPGIEDSRFGLGLGLVLVRNAAANHGGTVLIRQPEGAGTQVTLTIAIRQSTDTLLRSPVMRVDYAGERDHGLIELSDCLPASAYETK